MSGRDRSAPTAYVLHQRPYRETSLLLSFFTPAQGKQTALVKGARATTRAAKAKRALYQPFQPLHLQWRVGRSDLVTLTQIEPQGLRFPMSADATMCGLYLNELLYKLASVAEASRTLFDAYERTLLALAQSEQQPQPRYHQAWSLRQFEWVLLQTLGVAFDLDKTGHGALIEPKALYDFSPGEGLVLAAPGAISGACVQAFAQGQPDLETQKACHKAWRGLFRRAIDHLLDGQVLQARNLFVFDSKPTPP